MSETLSTTRDEISAAVAALESANGIEWAYDLLDDVCERHGLADAVLVLHPEPSNVQIFRRARRAIPASRTAALSRCPSGVFDPTGVPSAPSPDTHADLGVPLAAAAPLDEVTSAVLGTLCDARYRTLAAHRTSMFDATSGLLSRHAIDAALARAAACGARYGWTSTIVLLSTGGDAPADRRWQALADALRTVIRSGDDAGALATGTALVILGNVGFDAVRPFVVRVRAALSAAGFDDVDLFVATATTPRESVDPAELRQLALGRLDEMGAQALAAHGDRATVELAVRSLPGVVWMAWPTESTPRVTVGAWRATDELAALVRREVHERVPGAAVDVVDVGAEASDGTATRGAFDDGVAGASKAAAALPRANGHSDAGTGSLGNRDTGAGEKANGPPPLLSATAPGADDDAAASRAARVLLLRASFDAGQGVTEVTLGRGPARGTGQAPAGPLLGGAQGTLSALHVLGEDVPLYLVSAERALGVPGEPVVVVLGAQQRSAAPSAGSAGADELIGVAGGADDAEAASRATLSALNRYLSKPRPS